MRRLEFHPRTDPTNVIELSPVQEPKPKPERKARVPVALTERRVKALKAVPGMVSDGASRGLWLRTTQSHHQQWVHRYQYRGTRREMGLGSTDIVSLEEARQACLAGRKSMFAGIDPLVQRREQQATERKADTTFAAVAADYISVKRSGAGLRSFQSPGRRQAMVTGGGDVSWCRLDIAPEHAAKEAAISAHLSRFGETSLHVRDADRYEVFSAKSAGPAGVIEPAKFATRSPKRQAC
jgi:hypothetical protein